MKFPMATVVFASLLLAAGPGFGQAAGDDSTVVRSPTGEREIQPTAVGDIGLVPAETIVGRDLLAEGGEPAGRIRHVVVDMVEGTANFVLASPAGAEEEGQVYAVPWGLLDVMASGVKGPVRVRANLDRLSQAPTLSKDELSRITDAELVAQIRGHYQLPEEARRTEGPASALIGVGGMQVFARMAPAQQVGGTPVVSADGQEIGTVAQVILDAAEGRVAYVVVAREGVQEGQAQLPVPIQAMAWSQDQGALVLPKSQGELAEAGEPAPDPTADRGQLARIYEEYGVDAYWD